MKKIKVLTNCRAGGKSLTADKDYTVGKDVSKEDANTLIQLGRAEEAVAKNTSNKKNENSDDGENGGADKE